MCSITTLTTITTDRHREPPSPLIAIARIASLAHPCGGGAYESEGYGDGTWEVTEAESDRTVTTRTDNQEKDEKQSQNDKTGLGMEKTVKDKAKSKPESQSSQQKSQLVKVKVNPDKSKSQQIEEDSDELEYSRELFLGHYKLRILIEGCIFHTKERISSYFPLVACPVVAIVRVVIVVMIFGVVVVVDDVSLIFKLSLMIIGFLHRITLYYLIH
ncbi:hypothetical protein Tco_0821621 [Tanacetum coccineum]|uniref:Uncharacterized protein n=1 Tax=Tanacetum coccineum TaxID=301880 RepID=A0ABQ5AFE3_9ASTR